MKKSIFSVVMALALLAILVTPVAADKPTDFDDHGNVVSKVGDTGFDEFGYNDVARIFSGTGLSWCMAPGKSEAYCLTYMAPYAYDKLVMKWNAEWDRGKAENWAYPPYNAWTDNEWSGTFPGGSGEIWHYKFVWVGPCGVDGTALENGGYCIWGQFAVIMSQGTAGGEHFWDTLANPAGYGAYYSP